MTNDYINWKAPEWMILDKLSQIVLSKTPGCVVDIGIGETTRVLARHAKALGCKQYSIDTNFSLCEMIRKSEDTHKNHVIFHGRSMEFIKTFNDKPSVVLIDGQHNAEVVRKEVDFFLDKMVPNGVIFMHDTCPMENYYERKLETKGIEMDTYKVRKELEQRTDIDVFTWRYGVGFTMVLKKDLSAPFYRI